MDLMLGLDIGTSGAKGLLVDTRGHVVANISREYPMMNPRPLWAEQDPEDWWKATCGVMKELSSIASKIDGAVIQSIGLTGQMHGLVLLDEDGNVLRPCIMWNDQRTEQECDEITKTIGYRKLLEITGNPVLPGFTLPKILWVKKNEPNIYARIKHVLLPKDFIRYKLSGQFISDVSDASGMSMLDIRSRTWSGEILETLSISKNWLPDLVEGPEPAGLISKDASELTGVPVGTVIAGGGGDQAAGAVGSGTVEPGITSVVLGTSGVVFSHSDELEIEKEGRLHAFCHAVPGAWHLMGVTLSAAGSLKWYRELNADLEGSLDFDALVTEAETVEPGSEGLIFLPYLSGERTPHPDPKARGGFIGLTIRHTRAHMTRAVLEGVAYSLNDCLSLIRDMNIPVNQVRVTGGGAKSTLWKQILANVLDAEIVTLEASDGAPNGAALLGGVAGGIFPDVRTACRATVRTVNSIKPSEDGISTYKDFYEVYKRLYGALKDTNHQLTDIIINMEKR